MPVVFFIMLRFRTLLYNSTFFLCCFLAFILLFESRIQIPAWLQVVGRMHPLLLHFPITLLVLYGLAVLFFPRPPSPNAKLPDWTDDVLLAGAFTATLTALMGILLSQEEGYEAEMIFWHKWTGVATAFLSFGWYSFRSALMAKVLPARLFSGVAVVLMLATGHLGGNLTHGESFLISPLLPANETESVALDEALVFAHVVQPILEEKCVSCHNTNKAKGELIMTTAELLQKGGKNGTPWDTTQADLGLLLRRVHLAPDDKKHMPPKGKTQLTAEEIQVLESWIRRGASFMSKVVEFPAQDPLFIFASNRLQSGGAAETFDFAAASDKTIRELTTNYRVITPLSANSPGLTVNFFNAASFKSSDLTELSPIKEQIVVLDASFMPLQDSDLATISQFSNLRKLVLNFTGITGKALNDLTKLSKLRELSLTGNTIQSTDIQKLKEISSLQRLYLWNTAISPEDFVKIRNEMKNVTFESGFRSDTVVLQLNPPLIETKEQIIKGESQIRLKHQIAGTVIRYTVDGTQPDSLSSLVYKNGIQIKENTRLIARAFKPGWYGSGSVERTYYRTTSKPDSVQLLTKPGQQYAGQAGKVLIDGVKSDRDFKNGKWVGFREEPLSAMFYFQKPISARQVSLSMLQNIGSSIFPPVRLEVWGGMEAGKLKLLGSKKLPIPAEKDPRNEDLLYEFSFTAQPLKYIKVIAVPLAKLPPWHSSKGEPGWVFMDEILIN
ncbi:FN3 associated domain-containing protein [Arundinibacter roseus]|uniref:Uncharacterized protein n=1 Tax=Arundinibacter roseus TaxID=2070510 RepID=A0A4R4KK23_9BACT|nr:FN3 associated domain-containing protein [Arundinibacter roseus]TDB66911.1 hypothetical protein EZE20_07245 [Arundinibacter roseus]